MKPATTTTSLASSLSLSKGVALLAAILLVACSDDSATEKIVEVAGDGIEVVSDVSQLPACSSKNDGEMVWVKNEVTPRMCSDGKWYAVAEGSVTATCSAEPLKDGSGVKIICGGDSIGVVLNGVKGAKGDDGAQGEQGKAGKDGSDGKNGKPGADGQKGAQGIQGEKGDTGPQGAGCSMEQVDDLTARVTCGTESTILYIAELPDTTSQETIELDSEKVAISLDSVSGVTQKGPFLMGSKVLVREMEDGRTLTQTGNSFNGKILNDKGEFKINARMLVSQYVMLEATGYYRNEVTGKNSNSELTLFAITDVNDRNIVNVNLLTHLEYERVVYLVTQKKMKVKAAKKQAQKEVFGLLGIDATDFSNSEDLNIAGASDEDGALLAFSLMFQGDRSVADLTALLQAVANDMEKDGTWDDEDTRMSIAEWAADADSAGRLTAIRNNVKSWGLSNSVPNFEKYVRSFWYSEYGLGDCNSKKVAEVKMATAGKRSGAMTRYICKDMGNLDGGFRWVIASDFEKNTYNWDPGYDGEIERGSVTQDKLYVYDAVAGAWHEASELEQIFGACIESVEADITKNTGNLHGGDDWYKCENREWVSTTAYFVDTQGWGAGNDGEVVKGDSSAVYYPKEYYVYDEAEKAWYTASSYEQALKLGCTTNRIGEIVHGDEGTYYDGYFMCAKDHEWIRIKDKVANNVVGYDCDEDGKIVYGAVDTKTLFVCDGNIWRDASTSEESAGEACTDARVGKFNKDSTRVCKRGNYDWYDNRKVYTMEFRLANIYDFDVGARDYLNPELEYGSMTDKRDGRSYKTVTINGKTVMAENLNYGDYVAHSYLIDNSWCFNDDSMNCRKGGRLYTWTAAMDIDSKWQQAFVPAGIIKKPHQGICPEGWHIPTYTEWNDLLGSYSWEDLMAKGNPAWTDATNASGFSVLPAGVVNVKEYQIFRGEGEWAYFWHADEYFWQDDMNEKNALDCVVSNHQYGGSYGTAGKHLGMSVRCFQDTPEVP